MKPASWVDLNFWFVQQSRRRLIWCADTNRRWVHLANPSDCRQTKPGFKKVALWRLQGSGCCWCWRRIEGLLTVGAMGLVNAAANEKWEQCNISASALVLSSSGIRTTLGLYSTLRLSHYSPSQQSPTFNFKPVRPWQNTSASNSGNQWMEDCAS